MNWNYIKSKLDTLQMSDLRKFLYAEEMMKNSFSDLIKIADYLRVSKKYKATLNLTDVIFGKCPTCVELVTLLDLRCKLYWDSSCYKDTIVCCSLLIDIDPKKQDKYYNNRGCVYWELGDYKSAMHDFQESIKINPVNKFALRGAGEMFLLEKSYDEAIHYFQRALAVDPTPVRISHVNYFITCLYSNNSGIKSMSSI